MMNNYALRTKVIACLDNLEELIAKAQDRLLAANDPAVLVIHRHKNRSEAVSILTTLSYQDAQEPIHTLFDPGIICCSDPDLSDWVTEVNTAKQDFRYARLEYAKAMGNVAEKQRGAVVQKLLRSIQRGRLNLLQCDRRWNLLPADTLKVGFTWCRGGKIVRKVTVNDVKKLITKAEKESTPIPGAWAALSGLPEDEPLAIVRSQADHVRANLVTQQGRKMLVSPTPLLMPGSRMPEHNWLPPSIPERSRLRRSDQTIADEPLIPVLQVYPYIK